MGTSASFAATSLVAEDITGSDTSRPCGVNDLDRQGDHGGAAPSLWRLDVARAFSGRGSSALGAFFAFLAVVTESIPSPLIRCSASVPGRPQTCAARYAAPTSPRRPGPRDRHRRLGGIDRFGLGPTVALGGTGWIALTSLARRTCRTLHLAIVVAATAVVVVDRQLRDPLLRSLQLDVAGPSSERRRLRVVPQTRNPPPRCDRRIRHGGRPERHGHDRHTLHMDEGLSRDSRDRPRDLASHRHVLLLTARPAGASTLPVVLWSAHPFIVRSWPPDGGSPVFLAVGIGVVRHTGICSPRRSRHRRRCRAADFTMVASGATGGLLSA